MAKRIGRFTGLAPWEHNQLVAARKAVHRYEAGKQLTVDDLIILINNIANVFTLYVGATADAIAAALHMIQNVNPDWCAACYADTLDGHIFTGNCRHTPIEADL